MIDLNLLPEELRPRPEAPAPVGRAALYACLALLAILAALNAYCAWGVLPAMRDAIANRETTLRRREEGEAKARRAGALRDERRRRVDAAKAPYMEKGEPWAARLAAVKAAFNAADAALELAERPGTVWLEIIEADALGTTIAGRIAGTAPIEAEALAEGVAERLAAAFAEPLEVVAVKRDDADVPENYAYAWRFVLGAKTE